MRLALICSEYNEQFFWGDGWWIHFKGDDDFIMIRFDIINVLLKYHFKFKLCYFNSSVHTNLFKILVKRCGDFRKKCVSCTMNCYEKLANISISTSVASVRHSVSELKGTSYFPNILWFLVPFFLELHQFFLFLFETLIGFIKVGLEFGLKVIFRIWILRGDSKHVIYNMS